MAMLQVLSISIDGVPDNEKTCRDEIEKDRGRPSLQQLARLLYLTASKWSSGLPHKIDQYRLGFLRWLFGSTPQRFETG